MKKKTLQLEYMIAQEDELSDIDQELLACAKEATKRSYAPYSKFRVGVALLLQDGVIVTGNNQENIAYPSGICAERCAVFYANAQYPDKTVLALAVVACKDDNSFFDLPITPCGACRQVLIETENRYNYPIRLLLYGQRKIYIFESCSDLLPFQFENKA